MKLQLRIIATLWAMVSFSSQAENIQDRWDVLEENRWSAFFSVDYSRNRFEDTASAANRLLSGTSIIRYSLNDDTRLQAVISGYHASDSDTYPERGDFWNDTSLAITQNNVWNPLSNVTMSADAKVYIPTSTYSQKRDLMTAFRGGVRFLIELDEYVSGLYISDFIRIKKNFHQYKTAGNEVLEEYRFSNIIALDYYFTDLWSFSSSVEMNKTWNYSGGGYSPDINVSSQFGYQITEKFDVAAGVTNGASYFNPEQGRDPLSDLVDVDKMTFYVTLNYQL